MNKYMKIAKDMAEKNLITNDGGPFGACVIKHGEIIGKGSNQVLKTNDPTAHAEITAIRDACKNSNSYDLSDCELYTTSYPCPMCISAIIWSNIKKVYYGNSVEDTEKIGFRDSLIYEYINNKDSKILELNSLDREETIKIYEKYQKKEDQELY